MSNPWTPSSWRGFPIQQQPIYDDPDAVERALDVVRALPPLVAPGEAGRDEERHTDRKQLAGPVERGVGSAGPEELPEAEGRADRRESERADREPRRRGHGRGQRQRTESDAERRARARIDPAVAGEGERDDGGQPRGERPLHG